MLPKELVGLLPLLLETLDQGRALARAGERLDVLPDESLQARSLARGDLASTESVRFMCTVYVYTFIVSID